MKRLTSASRVSTLRLGSVDTQTVRSFEQSGVVPYQFQESGHVTVCKNRTCLFKLTFGLLGRLQGHEIDGKAAVTVPLQGTHPVGIGDIPCLGQITMCERCRSGVPAPVNLAQKLQCTGFGGLLARVDRDFQRLGRDLERGL